MNSGPSTKRRDPDAEQRDCHGAVVDPRLLARGRDHAEHQAGHRREAEREQAELDADRERLRDDLVRPSGSVSSSGRGPVQPWSPDSGSPAHVVDVLLPQRPVERGSASRCCARPRAGAGAPRRTARPARRAAARSRAWRRPARPAAPRPLRDQDVADHRPALAPPASRDRSTSAQRTASTRLMARSRTYGFAGAAGCRRRAG